MSKALEKKIIDICVFLHTELSSMQTQLDDSIMDLSEVLRLEVNQALELICGNIKDLLKLKRSFIQMDDYRNYKAHEQYQKALQKLECEVRNHIKIEQQMKLHIDSTQAKLEELEKFKDDRNSGNSESLRKENLKLSEKIKILEKQMENNEEKNRLLKEISLLKNLNQKESLKNNELVKVNHQMEIELAYLKRKVEMLTREIVLNRGSKENRPESGSKRKSYEDHQDEIRVVSSQLTERCRNDGRTLNKHSEKKHVSKSPISRADLKRTESQFLSSSRGIKKCSTINDRIRKQSHASSSN
jgi:hypothetical protein